MQAVLKDNYLESSFLENNPTESNRISELEKQVQSLKEGIAYGKIRLLQTLSSALAHELRSPVTTINLESSYASDVIIPELDQKIKNKKYGEISINKTLIEQIEDGFTNIKQSVDVINNIINVMINNITELEKNPNNAEWLSRYGITL